MVAHKKDISHTDISSDSFVDRFFPKGLIPYLKLARVDRPIGTWLLLFPGLWGIVLASDGLKNMDKGSFLLMILFMIGALFMRGAGCTINDIWDRKLDQKVERTAMRPLASGQLNIREVLIFLGAQLFAGLIILLLLNSLTIKLGFIIIIPILIYPLMKRITWWPQLFLGLTFNWSALMGWTAITGELSITPFLLYIAGIFWTLGYDTIYAHQDKEDDLIVGIKSTALKFGDNSPKWVSAFYFLTLLFLALAKLSSGMGLNLFSLTFLLFAIWHLYGQIIDWDIDNPLDCLNKFKSNKWFGAIVLLFLAA